jgi:hypothetical protein
VKEEWASIDQCRKYVEGSSERCVHCKWFEMMDCATVQHIEALNLDVVCLDGFCVRYPPKVFMQGGETEDHFPSVSGNERCGEYSKRIRTPKEIAK